MNSAAYSELFRSLGFYNIELRKKLKHVKVMCTIYFNRDREGFVYFAVYTKDMDLFNDDLWNFIDARQKKDDKPNLRTVEPKAGKEQAAFQSLLTKPIG